MNCSRGKSCKVSIFLSLSLTNSLLRDAYVSKYKSDETRAGHVASNLEVNKGHKGAVVNYWLVKNT